jgi:tetratricopeptide (TPR) repeat protein
VILVAVIVIAAVVAGMWRVSRYLPFLPATLSVETNPPGAMIFIDEKYVGVSPVEDIAVTRQSHMLRAQKNGYKPACAQIDIRGWRSRRRVALKRMRAGKLTIKTTPSRARVFVDGKLAGRSPIELEDLAPGSHRVLITHDNYYDFAKAVDLKTGKAQIVNCVLKSRAEDLYLQRIAQHPKTLANYVELAHHYTLHREFGKAAATFKAAVVLAASGPDDRDQVSRLYQELEKVYTEQYDYGGEAEVNACRASIDAMAVQVIKENAPGAAQLKRYLQKLYAQTNRKESIMKLCEASVAARPNDISAHADLAMMYVRRERYDDAMRQAEIVRQASPHNWQGWYALGLVHRARGEKQKARVYLKVALLYCPNDSTKKESEKIIQGLE